MAKECLYEGCENARFSNGYCQWHQSSRTDEKWIKTQKKKKSPVKVKKKASFNFVSDKLLAWLKIFRQIRDEYLRENDECEVEGCCNTDVTVHHKAGRSYAGFADEWARENNIPLLIDVRFFMSCCTGCHYKIHHQDTGWAYEQEYLIPK